MSEESANHEQSACLKSTFHSGIAASRPLDTECIIRCLQICNLLRSVQYAVTNTAATALQLHLTGGDHAKVVRVLSVATTLSSALEMVISPFIGRLSDQWGRKPLLLVGGMAKCLPYVMNAISPSLIAFFINNMVGEAAFQVYSESHYIASAYFFPMIIQRPLVGLIPTLCAGLAESSIVADLIKDTRGLAIGTARVKSMGGAAQALGRRVLGRTRA